MSDESIPVGAPPPLASEYDYRSLLDQVPAILYIADVGEDGVWRYVSRWIEPILGFTAQEWLTQPSLWASRIHPQDRDRALAREREAANTRVWNGEPIEYRMLHRDGHHLWIRDESTLQSNSDGRLHWHGVLSDITRQKQFELELGRHVAAAEAISRIGEHALERVSVPHLLDEACAAAVEVVGVESAMVIQLGPDQELTERAVCGWSGVGPGQPHARVGQDSQIGYTLATGKAAQVDDWDEEQRFLKSKVLIKAGVRSSLCVRIEGESEPFGIFGVLSRSPHPFSAADVHYLQALANVISDAIERQLIEDAIEQRALHDPLTGLPNRVLFLDRLEQALERVHRNPSLAAMLFVDVDRFKHINDTLGHHAGDELLVGVATRLRESVRPSDTVARFGGDEFGLLLDGISSERHAIATAERIAASFARPFVLAAGSHFVTASIGIALADGHHEPAALIRDADAAMYRAKERGRARYDVFDENMRVRTVARLRLENDLRRALDQHELTVVYQPVVELLDESIRGAEALLRWEHPERGPISPAEFIPVAEESGLIDRLGQWVLEEACREAERWAQARPDARPVRVGVNVSLGQLVNTRFPDLVAETLAASGLDADQLLLEIPEPVLVDDSTGWRRTVTRLHRIGVNFAIDQFGVGKSSLSLLGSLPLSSVKLSRTLVSGPAPADAGMASAAATADADTRLRVGLISDAEPAMGASSPAARAVIAMARALGVRVVGVGTETVEQANALHEQHCDYAQGFLFSPPVTGQQLLAMVVEGARLPRTVR